MKVGFTGTREGLSEHQRSALYGALLGLKDSITEFHHGDCVGGDAEAHEMAAVILGEDKIWVHPPEDPSRRAFCKSPHILPPQGYLARDLAIVTTTERLIACPKAGAPAPRSGTWYTVRRAQERKKGVLILKA